MDENDARYGAAVLHALMGYDGAVARIELLGKPPTDDTAAADYGLQFIERRKDGLYVTQASHEGLLLDEFSALLGDTELTCGTGAPLLPIPFSLHQLRAVAGGALGIVERLQSVDDTDKLIQRMARANAEAAELARALIYGTPAEEQERRLAWEYSLAMDALKAKPQDDTLAKLLLMLLSAAFEDQATPLRQTIEIDGREFTVTGDLYEVVSAIPDAAVKLLDLTHPRKQAMASLDPAAVSADEMPQSLPYEPSPRAPEQRPGPPPLATRDIAHCFAGLKWKTEEEWMKPLGDLPKWLEACIAMPGRRGGQDRRWNPVLIGGALVRRGRLEPRSVRARFQTKQLLQPWLEEWKTYEAQYLDSD